jgi:Protein of unknown function (DUF2795)
MKDGVTRVEIAEAVRAAFEGSSANRSELLAAATAAHARAEVLETLAALPDGRFREIRNLWEDLRHLPVGA